MNTVNILILNYDIKQKIIIKKKRDLLLKNETILLYLNAGLNVIRKKRDGGRKRDE